MACCWVSFFGEFCQFCHCDDTPVLKLLLGLLNLGNVVQYLDGPLQLAVLINCGIYAHKEGLISVGGIYLSA